MSQFLITLILVVVISLLSSTRCNSFSPGIRHQLQHQNQQQEQKQSNIQQRQQQSSTSFTSKRFLASTTNTEQETKVNAFFASTTTIDINDNNKSSSSSLSSSLTPYQRIGITEDQLALGVSADEVLKYIGTREQLIEKTLKDIPTIKREQAENEVNKFYLDGEMINMYIQYGKEIEKDPNFVVPTNENDNDNDGFFSFRTLVIAYLGYVSIDSIPKVLRNYIYDLQIENKWDNTNIQFFDTWIQDTTSVVQASREARAAAAAAAAAAASGNEVDTSNQSFFEGIGTAITNLLKQVTSSSVSSTSISNNNDFIIQSSSSSSTESVTDAATSAAISTVDSLLNNLGIPSTVDTSAISDALTSM